MKKEFIDFILQEKHEYELTDEEAKEIEEKVSVIREEIKKRNYFEEKITVKELFQKASFAKVLKVIRETYDKEKEFEDNYYKKIYLNILNQKQIPDKEYSEGFLIYEESDTPFSSEICMYEMDKFTRYAVDFMEMDEISFLYVHPKSLKTTSVNVLVAYIIDELGWVMDEDEKESILERIRETKEAFDLSREDKSDEEEANKEDNGDVEIKSEVQKIKLEDLIGELEEDNSVRKGKTIRDFSKLTKDEDVIEEILTTVEEKGITLSKKPEEILKEAKEKINKKKKEIFIEKVKMEPIYGYFFSEKNGFSCLYDGQNVLQCVDFIFEDQYDFYKKPAEEILATFAIEICDGFNWPSNKKYQMDHFRIKLKAERKRMEKLLYQIDDIDFGKINEEDLKSLSFLFERIKDEL